MPRTALPPARRVPVGGGVYLPGPPVATRIAAAARHLGAGTIGLVRGTVALTITLADRAVSIVATLLDRLLWKLGYARVTLEEPRPPRRSRSIGYIPLLHGSRTREPSAPTPLTPSAIGPTHEPVAPTVHPAASPPPLPPAPEANDVEDSAPTRIYLADGGRLQGSIAPARMDEEKTTVDPQAPPGDDQVTREVDGWNVIPFSVHRTSRHRRS